MSTMVKSEGEPAGFIDTLTCWFDWGTFKARNGILLFKRETEMPWWATICSVTLGLRIIMFPLRLRAWRNGQLMRQCTEHCNVHFAPILRSLHTKERADQFKTEMLQVHKELAKHVGFSPWKSLSPLPVSVPLFLGVAAALRGFDFEGEGLGMIWKDFGEAAWTSALPVTLTNFIFIEFSRRTAKKPDASNLKKQIPFILGHLINSCSFMILTTIPSGVNIFLLTSAILSLLESVWIHRASPSSSKKEAISQGLLNRWIRADFERRVKTFKITDRTPA